VQGGYTLGAALTGLVGLWLLPAFGWQALFALGGAMTLIMVPAVALLMPESPDFLLARRPPGALQALNKTLRAMHRPALSALPEAAKARPGLRDFLASLRLLFSTEYRMPTVLLWVAFFMSFATLYFLQSWVPQLTANAGLPDEQAFWAGTILNFGSFTGMASVGFLADRFGLRRVISTYLGAGAVALLFFGYLETTSAILIGLGLIGLMQGGFIGLYAVGAQIYPAAVRTTGVGWAIGIARPGAILGPAFAGLLVAEGLGMAANFRVFALPLVIAAIAVLSIRARALDAPAAASTAEGDLSAARTPASAARET
jgi:MFS family permease